MRSARWCAALFAGVFLAAAAVGCAGPPAAGRAVVLTGREVAVLRSLGSGDTRFGLSVLSALCARQPGTNVVVSPVSLATGLGMAYLGARGATAAAMARVLQLPGSGPGLVAALQARRALLASLSRPGVTFAESNRLWADPSLVTSRSFARALASGYRAGVTRVPLLAAPSLALARINAAVSAQTRGHIRHLLPAGSIPPDSTGWVITNALYLNATWQRRFDRAKTAPGPFRTSTGAVVTARYMHGGGYGYATAAGWTATELRYRGGRLAMLALLPPTISPGQPSAAGGCQVPDVKKLRALLRGLAKPGEGHQIALPTIRLASSESLKQVLTRLGMGLAFSRRADFSGISPQAWRLGFVQHAATLSVDEKGAVATAGTAVGIQPSSLPVPLNFNRPYLLIIIDTMTAEPLMTAWVANPAKS